MSNDQYKKKEFMKDTVISRSMFWARIQEIINRLINVLRMSEHFYLIRCHSHLFVF
jgi:hypothetical protein